MEKPEISGKGKTTRISFYTPDERVESAVKNELERVLSKKNAERYHSESMKGILYTCVKELFINASRNNIRHTYMKETRISAGNEALYTAAAKRVRRLLNDHYFSYAREKLKKHGFDVNIRLEEKPNGIVISVVNPESMNVEEEKSVRCVLNRAMKSGITDILNEYSREPEENGGADMGLYMVIGLLRQIGIKPDYFRIGSVGQETIARIELPLTDKYVGIRERSARKKNPA